MKRWPKLFSLLVQLIINYLSVTPWGKYSWMYQTNEGSDPLRNLYERTIYCHVNMHDGTNSLNILSLVCSTRSIIYWNIAHPNISSLSYPMSYVMLHVASPINALRSPVGAGQAGNLSCSHETKNGSMLKLNLFWFCLQPGSILEPWLMKSILWHGWNSE